MTVIVDQKNLRGRLDTWLEKPLRYKFKSISTKVFLLIYQILFPLFKSIYKSKIVNNKFVSASIFDIAKPNTYLCCNGLYETFLVASGDKGIAKRVFIDKEPFDYEKVTKVIALLGPTHTKSLLIDVGANIGTICIPAVNRNIFQQAIAIEPEPKNYSLLLANIAINNLTNKIKSLNIALGESDNQELSFELSNSNYGDHRIRKSIENGFFDEMNREVIKIRSDTLDKILLNQKPLNPNDVLIWIDTQGYEGYVLSGGQNVLNLHPPICLEFWPYGLKRSGCFQNLIDALIKNGYSFFIDLEVSDEPISLSVESLNNLYNKYGEEGNYTDILCT